MLFINRNYSKYTISLYGQSADDIIEYWNDVGTPKYIFIGVNVAFGSVLRPFLHTWKNTVLTSKCWRQDFNKAALLKNREQLRCQQLEVGTVLN